MKEMNASDETEAASNVEEVPAGSPRIAQADTELHQRGRDRLTVIKKESRAEGPRSNVQNTGFEILPEVAIPPSLPPEDPDTEMAVAPAEVAEIVGLPEEDISKALTRLHEN